jgi:hypothetical protein
MCMYVEEWMVVLVLLLYDPSHFIYLFYMANLFFFLSHALWHAFLFLWCNHVLFWGYLERHHMTHAVFIWWMDGVC